jgi:hypothetical protein
MRGLLTAVLAIPSSRAISSWRRRVRSLCATRKSCQKIRLETGPTGVFLRKKILLLRLTAAGLSLPNGLKSSRGWIAIVSQLGRRRVAISRMIAAKAERLKSRGAP